MFLGFVPTTLTRSESRLLGEIILLMRLKHNASHLLATCVSGKRLPDRARLQKPGFSTKDSGFHVSIVVKNPVSGLAQDLS